MNMICLLSWIGLVLSANDTSVAAQPADCYGDAVVAKILSIDQTCILYCDIQDLPPIIGKNMPVKISGLKTANTPEYNQKIHTFLTALLLSKTDTPQKVCLRNIRRGDTFCFLADIEINGEDLCDLLVENGLAQRIIQVKTPALQNPPTDKTPASNIQRTQPTGYVASKTSKIFHRAGCSHAKRINDDKATYFSSRQEAVRAGRQPCKICNP